MDSNQTREKQPTNDWWWVILLIIGVAAILGGVSLYVFVFRKQSTFKNIGTPAPGVGAPPAAASMTNVTGGNMGAVGGNARLTGPIK